MLAKIVLYMLACSLLLPVVMFGQDNKEFQLSDYRWQNRLVLVFAPSPENADYLRQIEELNRRKDDLLDRDLKIFHLFRDDSSFGDGRKIDNASVRRLYEKYDADPEEYLILLIGKDGTEKLRRSHLLKPDTLFAVIDSMPMRRHEMQDDGN